MEETRQAARKAPQKKQQTEKTRDWFLFVTLSQCLSCALVLALLAAFAHGDSARANGLRADYRLLLSRQLQMEDVSGAVDVLRELWTPQTDTAAVMAQPDEETTTATESLPAETSTTAPAPATDAAEEADVSDPQPVTAKQLQVTQKPAAAAGGSDQTGNAAAKNTSFSPSAVTVPITRPVAGGRYSSYFGYRNNPITHQYAFHTGLDIAVPTGTAIRAAYGGTVRLVGEDSRSGKYVTISHDDGYETFYCHCSETLVTEGTVVRAGEAVAKVGSTGWATGPHLHFEIRKDGTKLDPLQILERDA